jgi:hypothetical protein
MNLHGRDLKLGMKGPDVDLLLKELRALQHVIPPTEIAFGKATRQAVLAIQKLSGLPQTGVVNNVTAVVINRLFDQLQAIGKITGTVQGQTGDPLAGAQVGVAGTAVNVQTDAQGKYLLDAIHAGQVTIQVSRAGYNPQKAVVAIAPGRTIVQNFTLQKPDAGAAWSVRGRVVRDAATPLPGMRVVVLQVMGSAIKERGEAVTQANGEYEVKYAPLTNPVNLRIKVFAGAQEIGDSGVRENVLQSQPNVDVVVTASVHTGSVRGRVVRGDGSPVGGAEITIQRQGIRTRVVLGTVTTNNDGRYTLEYQRTSGRIDLRVEIVPDPAKGIKETNPRIIGAAGDDEHVDFVVNNEPYRGPAAFERVRQIAEPMLAGEGIALAELADFDESEIAVLAGKTGIEPRELVLSKQSATLAKQTGISADILHGMGRQRMPLSLPALLAQGPEKRRAAVERALAGNDIPQRLEQDAKNALAKLDELTVVEALKKPAAPGETTLGALFDIAGLADVKRTKLVTKYVSHAGTTDEFWKSVRDSGDLTGAEVDKVQFTLQLGALTQNHAPLVKALQAQGIARLQDLAKFDKSDWLDLIKRDAAGPAIGMPPDLKAAGIGEEDYADMLFCVVEDAVPSTMIAHRIAGFPQPEPLKTFFERNPGFDIRTTPVQVYLERNPAAIDFAGTPGQKAQLTKRLKGLERTYRVAPHGARVQTMQALVKNGVDSAHKIRTIGRTAFVRRFRRALDGTDRAELVYARAQHAAALATMLLARHSALFERAPIRALPRRPGTLKGFTGYEGLFGSLDFCSCDHCQSVYSPPAYLVDVLHWLHNRPSEQPGKTSLQILFDNRRDDIGTIELSCNNTNTPLPYIDVVNEVLERAVEGAGAQAYQTTAGPDDLLVHPEHLRAGAYETLAGTKAATGKDAVYPFNLPFNLWLEEVRTYLGQLGVPWHRVMEVLHAGGRAAVLNDLPVATEALGLAQLEREVIAGEPLNPARSTADCWGLPGVADWVAKLGNVAFLLERATPPLAEHGMQFVELADLLRARFIQIPGPVAVWFDKMTCDTTAARLVDLSARWLDRAHRFIRLSRRLGWTAQELDLAIQVLGGGANLRGGALTRDLLVKLSHVLRLQETLHVPLAEMLTWWDQLDTRRWKDRLKRGRPVTVPPETAGFGQIFNEVLTPQPEDSDDESFYDRLFQSKSVNADGNQLFGLAPSGDALLDETKLIEDYASLVAGPLKITGIELSKLLGRLADKKLSLANLSALYRHVSLARALNFTVDQLVSALILTGEKPFDQAHTENAVLFVEEVNAIRDSGFGIEELDYLLRHVDTQPATFEPQDKDIAVILRELGDDLRRIEAENQLPDAATPIDALRTLLEQRLALVVPADRMATALLIIDPQPQATLPGDDAQRTFIEQTFSAFLDPVDAKAKLVGGAQLNDRRARLVYVLERLLPHLRSTGLENGVVQKIADSIGLEPGITAGVLQKYLHHPGAGGVAALTVFRDAVAFQPSEAKPLPDVTDLAAQFATYKRMHKIALILQGFRIRLDELAWVFEHGPKTGTLDADNLPISVPNDPTPAYKGWARLRDAVTLRDTLTTGRLFDLFETAATFPGAATAAERTAANDVLLTALDKRTRWNAGDLRFLAGATGFNLAYPDAWKDERGLKRIAEAMAVVRRVGLRAEQLWTWRIVPAAGAQQAQAESVKQAVRSRYEEAEWRTVARSLRDGLREKQRNGLVGWLLGRPDTWGPAAAPWRVDLTAPRPDANDLFSHFLLDVEMSPCQLTSRIKQAMSSTQLFVQRALMNLEPDVILSADDGREWKWMKNYRVWEANRKVFLYPENWIEPELRDDKTPSFKEFEQRLLQDDVTAETAEAAFRAYLEDLDDVARLEVVGMFHEEELVRIEDAGRVPPVDVLHVFGRTQATPPTYYYRRRVDAAYWTPWERVELDIEGDQLLPVIYNRRLYVFWGQITEAALEEVPDSRDAPKRYYQIRLGWAERRNGKWSKKKLSPMQIGGKPADYNRLNPGLPKMDGSSRSDFFFRSYTDAGDLMVEVIRSLRGSNGGADEYIRLDRFRMSGCDGSITLEENPGTVIPDQVVIHGPDAAVYLVNGFVQGKKIYFFKGNQYSRYDVPNDETDSGYPKSISGHWPYLFTNIDAAVYLRDGIVNGRKIYFFKGNQYARYDVDSDEVENGYPKSITGHWPGLFTDIDAAVYLENGFVAGKKIYFFKGDQYIRWDASNDRIDAGYPASISANWPGLFSDIDAAFYIENGFVNGKKIYFFKGDQYIRWDVDQDRLDDGYPASITRWPGLERLVSTTVIPGGTMSERVTIRPPDDTDTLNQSFARVTEEEGLTLPAQNPATGALAEQSTLAKTPSPFAIVPLHLDDFRSVSPFVYQDLRRTFFVEPHDVYGWVRQPPRWTIPGAIPIDIVRTLPELCPPRPVPPAPDPWVYVPGAVVGDPAPIAVVNVKPPILIAAGAGVGPSGLLEGSAIGLATVFAPQVASLAGQPVTVTPNQIGVAATASVVAEGSVQLLKLQSAMPPADDGVRRTFVINRSFYFPPSAFNLVTTALPLKRWDGKRYRFSTFYHPYICTMMRALNRFGLDGLLDPPPSPLGLRRQQLEGDFFAATYAPIAVDEPFPRDNFDFSYAGAFSAYNWELFFHAPFLIAVHLTRNQRFEEAHRWFHYVFDPTESSNDDVPQRFWKVRPFYELFYGEDLEAGPIHELLLLLDDTSTDPERVRVRNELIEQVHQWRKNPFNPHAIARLRLAAYQKAVVMRYLDNLIEWGDQLFRRDTMESINEATQLYVLAAQILGRRPQRVPVEEPKARTFNDLLAQGLDELSNAAVEEVEGYLPEIPNRRSDADEDDIPLVGPTLFFCVPPNDKLVVDYWDRVADRLFKIHHCMNIEGVVRQLPLFEPPIDPALLVRATALGVDLSSALNDLSAPLPKHRYRVLAQKAADLCADVKALGAALLSALEKKDAEALALLRASHEIQLHAAIQRVREKQIAEAKETLEGLRRSKENAELRRQYYRSRVFMSPSEQAHVALYKAGGRFDLMANISNSLASILSIIPDFDAGTSGVASPVAKARFGGSNLSSMARAHADAYRAQASVLDRAAQLASIIGGHQRRADDWGLQGNLADKDIQALERQIVAAEIRVAVAESELDNLQLQHENAKEAETFLRDKYTNQALYQWMVGQLSSLYFQSYQLAVDLAKRAERAWQLELAAPDKSFIQFGYWDSLKRGLLAGERLHYDLKRMDAAYLEGQQREYELTRHVSLRVLDPLALVRLREEGECFVRIPEAWFDVDSPGHYLRRIKSVAITIPSVTGPYVSVRCTLTLIRSEVRMSAAPGAPYGRVANDTRFRDDPVGLQSIVTSRAQEDSGMFETNLGDERYLPFEGAGTISEWRISLPKQFRQFDYDTISDVVLHLRYTAREGGEALRLAAVGDLEAKLNELALAESRTGLCVFVSAAHEFQSAWHRFMYPQDTEAVQKLTLDFTAERFPFAFALRAKNLKALDLFLQVDGGAQYDDQSPLEVDVNERRQGGGSNFSDKQLKLDASPVATLPHAEIFTARNERFGTWNISVDRATIPAKLRLKKQNGDYDVVKLNGQDLFRLNPEAIEDVIAVIRYAIA